MKRLSVSWLGVALAAYMFATTSDAQLITLDFEFGGHQLLSEQYASLGVHFHNDFPLNVFNWPDPPATSGQYYVGAVGGAHTLVHFDRPISYFSVDMMVANARGAPTVQFWGTDASGMTSWGAYSFYPAHNLTWVHISMDVPAGHVVETIGMYAGDLSGAVSPEYGFDTLSFTYVPEPTSAALIGLAALLAFRSHPRRRSDPRLTPAPGWTRMPPPNTDPDLIYC